MKAFIEPRRVALQIYYVWPQAAIFRLWIAGMLQLESEVNLKFEKFEWEAVRNC
jgi:hypothetical protein